MMNAKVTQPVSDGAWVPTRSVQQPLQGVCSLALGPRKNLETQKDVLPSFRALAPDHDKRLWATTELTWVSSCGLALPTPSQDTFSSFRGKAGVI